MNEQINMKFTISELNLILESLGNMAYFRVHEVIHKIQSQAQEQVNSLGSLPVTGNGNTPPVAKAGNGVLAE
jgi:hypothetical protein